MSNVGKINMNETQFVKNNFINKDWPARGFIEKRTKKTVSLIYALMEVVIDDGGEEVNLGLAFTDNLIFAMVDEDTEEYNDLATLAKKCFDAYKKKDEYFPEDYEEEFIEIYSNGVFNEDALENMGIIDIIPELEERINDLNVYYAEEEKTLDDM